LVLGTAAIAPAAFILGLLVWKRWIDGKEVAGSLLPGVAIGLASGALLGTCVALVVLECVLLLSRALGR
jgi:hypothetical protein